MERSRESCCRLYRIKLTIQNVKATASDNKYVVMTPAVGSTDIQWTNCTNSTDAILNEGTSSGRCCCRSLREIQHANASRWEAFFL